MIADVPLHRSLHSVINSSSFGDTIADVGRADVQQRPSEQPEAVGGGWKISLQAGKGNVIGIRARHRDHNAHFEQPVRFMPSAQLSHRVHTQDQVHLGSTRRAAVPRPQISKRVHGVCQSGALHLHRRRLEVRTALNRQAHHRHPVLRDRDSPRCARLQPRTPGRDEDHPIQSQAPARRLRNRKMPVVNRVERAAQNADTSRRFQRSHLQCKLSPLYMKPQTRNDAESQSRNTRLGAGDRWPHA